MSLIHIEVTAEDIAKGEVGSSCSCPVALALKRKFQQPAKVSGTSVVTVKHADQPFVDIYEIPYHVQSRIDQYDYQGKMEPFEFDMEFIGVGGRGYQD